MLNDRKGEKLGNITNWVIDTNNLKATWKNRKPPPLNQFWLHKTSHRFLWHCEHTQKIWNKSEVTATWGKKKKKNHLMARNVVWGHLPKSNQLFFGPRPVCQLQFTQKSVRVHVKFSLEDTNKCKNRLFVMVEKLSRTFYISSDAERGLKTTLVAPLFLLLYSKCQSLHMCYLINSPTSRRYSVYCCCIIVWWLIFFHCNSSKMSFIVIFIYN